MTVLVLLPSMTAFPHQLTVMGTYCWRVSHLRRTHSLVGGPPIDLQAILSKVNTPAVRLQVWKTRKTSLNHPKSFCRRCALAKGVAIVLFLPRRESWKLRAAKPERASAGGGTKNLLKPPGCLKGGDGVQPRIITAETDQIDKQNRL